MLIRNIFAKPIDRRIDGVIKADQLDQESLWLELDEFVITNEVRKHLSGFFAAVKDAIDNPKDPAIAGRTGVWISGFFGSGKSMLLKIISLMIEDKSVSAHGKSQTPLEFILPKVGKDALMVEQIKACCGPNMESILFNIDSKGDSRKGDEAVLDVFYRVFNDRRGQCPGNPDVAEFEDALAERGWLDEFIHVFEERTGKQWGDCSARYLFYSKEIAQALQAVGDMSEAEAKKQIDGIKGMAKMSAENLALMVNRYLEAKGPKARLLFFVDEVGQFIGKNSKLMLNLQTITEELGVKSRGRAWVVVTAQEDIEAIIGELSQNKANDFSKITGRFYTKLKLSGANADEVLQVRLLEKTKDGEDAIEPLFSKLGDILRNAITFKSAGMTFQSIGDGKQFATDYPFLPYQFQLIPKIFSAIRKRGATGQHLAEGERSMLDAFQIAAKNIGDCEVGELVPLYSFYTAIESYLEAVVKRTIAQAGPVRGLSEIDVNLLKTLFLIRWVEEVKGNAETLVTLSLNHMDQDRAKLKAEIEASLQRLEKETLVSRNGDVYYFLTDEEQSVDREIRDIKLSMGEESREVGRLLYNETLKERAKHRFRNGKDFTVARWCDGRPVGTASNPELDVKVISPFDADYSLHADDGKAVLTSAADSCLVIVLPDDRALSDEITKYLQVITYLRTRQSADLPKETKRIQADRGTENDERRNRMLVALQSSFANARFFVSGQKFTPKASEPVAIFQESLEALIEGTFSQLGLLKKLADKPLADLQLALKANNVQKELLEVQRSENRDAIAAVKQRIDVLASQNKQIVLGDLIADFGRRPYGWPWEEVALVLARLLVAGECQLWTDGAVIPIESANDFLSKPGKWKQVLIQKKQAIGAEELAQARRLAQALFHNAVPNAAEEAVGDIRAELAGWKKKMVDARPYSKQAHRYPGNATVSKILEEIEPIIEEHDSHRFTQAFLKKEISLLGLQPTFEQISGFYGSQLAAWDRLLETYDRARPNEAAIRDHDADAATALLTLREILTSPEPYARVPEANRVAAQVERANKEVLAAAHEAAKAAIAEVQVDLDEAISHLTDDQATEVQAPLRDLKDTVEKETITGNLGQVRERATTIYNSIVATMAKKAKEEGTPQPTKAKPIRTIRPTAKTLETPEEVEIYLGELKTEILAAIAKGEKVQVQ